MSESAAPKVVVLAGPNGAGKTTFARALFNCGELRGHFVNADAIASGLSAFNVEAVAMEAGKVMVTYLRKLAERRVDFAFETTLASRSFHTFLSQLLADGYEVELIYLWLPDFRQAMERVSERVLDGGHNIPDEVVRRRYQSGLRNFFELYKPLVSDWRFYNNASRVKPELIASGGVAKSTVICSPELWSQIESGSKLP